MRKFTIVMALAVMSFTAYSQNEELTNKRGVPILPKAGDWSVSINAAPFLNYVGRMVSNGGATSPDWGFTAQNPGAISGKYVVSNDMAYRATILLGIDRFTQKSQNSTDRDKINKQVQSALAIGLSAGIERYTNSNSRLRGVYGFEAGVSKQPFSGTNAFTSDPLSGSYKYIDGVDNSLDQSIKGGNTWAIQGGVFVGAEYFVIPKLSISGEFGYALSLFTEGKQTITPSVASSQPEYVIPGSYSGMSLAPNASGSLILSLYF